MANPALPIILKALDPLVEKLKAQGVKGFSVVSHRTLRFDIPADKVKDGINRLKITAREDGTLDVRLIEITEHDLIGGVDPDSLGKCIQTFTGMVLE